MSARKDAVQIASRAHSNLTTFENVVAIIEAGIYGGNPRTNRASAKIIKACKEEQQKLLTEYDLAVLAIERDRP